jgi:hypothetical protein
MTKGKPLRRAPSVPDPEHEAAKHVLDGLDTAKTRRMNQLLHSDPAAALKELGLPKKK